MYWAGSGSRLLGLRSISRVLKHHAPFSQNSHAHTNWIRSPISIQLDLCIPPERKNHTQTDTVACMCSCNNIVYIETKRWGYQNSVFPCRHVHVYCTSTHWNVSTTHLVRMVGMHDIVLHRVTYAVVGSKVHTCMSVCWDISDCMFSQETKNVQVLTM